MARRRRPPRPGALADLAPLRILAHIALLQLSYYGVAIVLIVFTTLVAGQHITPGEFFDWHNVRADVTTGWTLGLCWMLDALLTVVPILLLIARSKLVPDFALTIHFVHLVVVSAYTRAVPSNIYWWLLQGCSAGLMISVGMWACQWRELRPMSFGGKGKQAANGHPREVVAHDDEGAGYEMSGAMERGRRGDGAPLYEMVHMEPRPEPT